MTSPEDFFSDKPPARIMGSETELNVAGSFFVGLFADIVIDQDSVAETYDAITKDGGRVYGDGSLLEVCTPECRGPRELAKHELALRHRLGDTAMRLGIKIYARTGYDHLLHATGETAGYHENYLLPLSVAELMQDDEKTRRALGSFLATRGVWAGSGMVATEQYLLTQKSDGVGTVFGGDATSHGEKPMFATWQESTNWGRLELRCTDVNMSPWTTMHKFALTSLFLRLIEYNAVTDDLIFSTPVEIMDEVAIDLEMNEEFETESGEWLTAIDHQLRIIDAALKLDQDVILPPEEITAAKEIKETLLELKAYAGSASPTNIAPRRLDAHAKRRFIERKTGNVEVSNMDKHAVQLDLMWDEISTGYGRRFWRDPRNVIVGFSDSALKKVLKKAPNTRALRRVQEIHAGGSGMQGGDWRSIGHHLYDPYGDIEQ